MKGKNIVYAAFAVSALMGSYSAQAAQGIALAGADGTGDSSYVYGGLILKPFGDFSKSGVVLKAFVHGLKYDLDGGAGTTIDAENKGASLSAGYQVVHGGGYIAGYIGGAVRNTDYSVPQPLARSNGENVGVAVGIDGSQKLGDSLRLDGILSYVSDPDDYWSRFRLMSGKSGSVSVGPEVVVQGSPDYDAWRLGLAVADVALTGTPIKLEFAVGYQNRNSDENNAYGNLGFSVPF